MPGETKRSSFDEQLAWGKEGERPVAAKLIREGHVKSLLPLFQFRDHGEAPFLLYKAGKLPLPDHLCWGDEQYFTEVKRKDGWINFVAAGRGLETGFNEHLFRAYQKVRNETGLEVWIFFLHEPNLISFSGQGYEKGEPGPEGVFVQSLTKLEQCARRWGGRSCANGAWVTKPEILFPMSALHKRWTLEELGER